eukprot:TRINITY_DN53262_c0_g1_i3.p1 TRINITY_DN53262_c0_g1~~TRINITY_DN53262_c0_g1_i3.p1  ORF type:complete len:162 (+),score=31.87 TRINITY_DN53262_c0_g1_i3:64-549(+)
MIRRPPRSTQGVSSAASDVYKRQYQRRVHGVGLDKACLALVEGDTKYMDSVTGAHFNFEDMCQRLKQLRKQSDYLEMWELVQDAPKIIVTEYNENIQSTEPGPFLYKTQQLLFNVKPVVKQIKPLRRVVNPLRWMPALSTSIIIDTLAAEKKNQRKNLLRL